MSDLIDLNSWPVSDVLSLLLQDKTTKKNIVRAENSPMREDTLRGAGMIRPRVAKELSLQAERTRKTAEVFTPAYVCCRMNEFYDGEWFGYPEPFNTLTENGWIPKSEPIRFGGKRDWKEYVDSRRMEITCGEAPFLVSRYDAATGEPISLEKRIGILDRKLRVVNENTREESEWMTWTVRAFQSVYGYELQGDSLLIARINLLLTFTDYLSARWNRKASLKELKKIANIISWNLWQMDGLTGSVPFAVRETKETQLAFDWLAEEECTEPAYERIPCRIMDWRADRSVEFGK